MDIITLIHNEYNNTVSEFNGLVRVKGSPWLCFIFTIQFLVLLGRMLRTNKPPKNRRCSHRTPSLTATIENITVFTLQTMTHLSFTVLPAYQLLLQHHSSQSTDEETSTHGGETSSHSGVNRARFEHKMSWSPLSNLSFTRSQYTKAGVFCTGDLLQEMVTWI